MSKFEVKNCPKAVTFPTDTKCEGTSNFCRDVQIERCLLKQIIQECKEAIERYDKNQFYDDDRDIFLGECMLASRIMSKVKVEEVD